MLKMELTNSDTWTFRQKQIPNQTTAENPYTHK